jgi:quinol monooxygenase YgiN
MRGEVVVVSRARVRAGQAARLLAEVAPFVAASRAEAGCVEYDLYLSATAYEEIATVERWVSAEAAQAHLVAPHTSAFLARVAPCLAAPPEIRVMPAG